MEKPLERNLRLYPKLKYLVDEDNRPFPKFLDSIYGVMVRSALSYNQAVTACKVIDEAITKRCDVHKVPARCRSKSN